MKNLLRICVGAIMLFAIIFTPLILEYGIKTVALYTIGVMLSVVWGIGGAILLA